MSAAKQAHRQIALSSEFLEFRRQRVAQLLSEGMPLRTARAFAKQESRGRARAALAIGPAAALAADLEAQIDGEQPSKFQLRCQLIAVQ